MTRPLSPPVVAGGCAAAFAGLTAYVVVGAPVTPPDRWIAGFTAGHRAPWATAVLEAWTWLGSTVVLIPLLAAVAVWLWWRRRDRGAVVYAWAALAGAVVLGSALKAVVGRARPPAESMLVHAGGHAYPSGHATQAIAVWGLLAVLAARSRARVPVVSAAAVVVVLVGVSRVYLGVHWATDVLGGYALGGAWLALLVTLRTRAAAVGAEAGVRTAGEPRRRDGSGSPSR